MCETTLSCASCDETVTIDGEYYAGHAALKALDQQGIDTGRCPKSSFGAHGWRFDE